MKEKSIFKRIFTNTVVVMTLFAVVAAAVVSVLICRNAYGEAQNRSITALNDYTYSVKKIIEETVQQSDYILNYNYLSENISRKGFSTEEKYMFSYNIAQYFKTIENEHTSYRVWFSNPELFEGMYFYNIKKFERSKNIKEILKSIDPFWTKDFRTDVYGNNTISFYRAINEENILECTVVLPKAADPNIGLVKDVPPNTFSIPVNENYSAVIQNENNTWTYVKIVGCVYAVMMLFYALLVLVVYQQNKKISASITGFIEMLDKIDIENIDKNEDIAAEINKSETENKELAVMKRIIYKLLQNVHQTAKQRYEIEYQRQETEYRLLQSQIDPHTLYNSLSAIKYNAFLKNDTQTMELVENMVRYYRAVLNRGKSVFTIGDEIEMLAYYVKINEFSHDCNYNFVTDVADDVKDIEVIHLLFQPFAENAILHGLIGREKEAELKISCKKDGEYLVFTISDNGYGMSAEQLEKLKDLENYEDSYGIKNAYRRMKFMYGKESSIIINSKENAGTTVVIKFKPK